MANDIVTPTSGSLDVATIMNTALAPFTIRDQWGSAIEAAWKARDSVAVDKDGDLVALGDAVDWHASRARAVEIQKQLPPHAEIVAAYKAVDRSLRVKPAPEDYQLLTMKMLDVLGLRGGDDLDAYAEAMAWSLAEAWSDHHDQPHWIPIPALAKAIKRTWEDRESWNHFGGTRRPPIPDIVDRCKDYRQDLAIARNSLNMLGRTSKRLEQIIRCVNG
jgi:hypothetical protein